MEKDIKGKAVISNRIYLSSTPKLFDKCKEALYYAIPPKTIGFGNPEVINDIVLISQKVFSIPVGRLDLIPEDYEIIDKRVLNEIYIPEPKIQLREDQLEIYDQVNDNCLINAKPGYGKTFTGLHIAYKLKQKTLVVVHNTALRDQWVEETKKLFGFEPGVIGTGRFETDTSIVISNTQTLYKHVDKYSKMFGTTIFDEVHRVPSAAFKRILDASYSRYKIGLSATIKRKDNKHVIIPDYFSPKLFVPEVDTAMKPTIIVVHSNIKLALGKATSRTSLVGKKGGQWTTLLTELCEREEYLELVSSLVDIKSNVEGHKVLCVADRISLLEECHQRVKNSIKVTSQTTGRTNIHKEFYKEDSLKSLFGTTSIYKEGISINPMSCLVLAVPINNEPLLEQIIGRVTRPHPGKKTPEIIDIALSDSISKRQFASRLGYYLRKGYKIKEVFLD